MAAIGDGWKDGAWVQESWVIGAWFKAGVSAAAVASNTAISIGIGVFGLMLVIGRTLVNLGEWW